MLKTYIGNLTYRQLIEKVMNKMPCELLPQLSIEVREGKVFAIFNN